MRDNFVNSVFGKSNTKPPCVSKQAILCEFLYTIDSGDSDDDVSIAYSVDSNSKHPPKNERTINVVHAAILPATAAYSAREKIGTFTGLLVQLWTRSVTLWISQ